MEIRILGCSGGRAPGHELSSYLVDDHILVDTGGACSSLSMAEQEGINDVIVTHAHLDHIMGLANLYENTRNSRIRPLDVYGTRKVLRVIRDHLFQPEIMPMSIDLDNDFPGINFHEVTVEQAFQIATYEVEAFPVFHTPGSIACRVSDDEHTFFFTGDTGKTDRIWRWIKERGGVDCLIAEVSFPNRMQQIADISRHLTPSTLADAIDKAAIKDPQKVHVVHLKPQFMDELRGEIKDAGKGKAVILTKGDIIRLDKGKRESRLLQETIEKKVRDRQIEFDSGSDLYEQREKLQSRFGLKAKTDEVIFHQGDRSRIMYIIQEGRVRITRNVEGQERTLSVLGQGDFFGEMAMLNNRPRTASAVAMNDVTLLAFDKNAFEQLVLDNFGVALRLIRTLAQRIQEADLLIENLLFLDPQSKVINTLIHVACDEGIEISDGLQVRITPEELADKSGVVIGTLRKLLTELVSEKLIFAKRGTIVIPDIRKLRRLLKFLELKDEFLSKEIMV